MNSIQPSNPFDNEFVQLSKELHNVNKKFLQSPTLTPQDLLLIKKILNNIKDVSSEELNQLKNISHILHTFKNQDTLLKTNGASSFLTKSDNPEINLFDGAREITEEDIFEDAQEIMEEDIKPSQERFLPNEILDSILLTNSTLDLFEMLEKMPQDPDQLIVWKRRQDVYWKSIATKLDYSLPKLKLGEVRNYVRDLIRNYTKSILHLRHIPKEIQTLLNQPISIDSFLPIKEWKDARDTVIVQYVILKTLGSNSNEFDGVFLDYNRTLQIAKKFTSFLSKNKNFPQLKELNLQKLNLTRLHDSIGNLTGLTSISLEDNLLTSLPESFGNLTNLIEIYAHQNLLIWLPESLGNLSALKTLEISENRLTSLPESIGNLSALKTLKIILNLLTSLPKSFGNLSNLIDLSLWYNELTSLPESFGNLSNLIDLSLRHNELTSLPESFGNLSALETLDIGENQINLLPKSFGNLSNLMYLKIYSNQLVSLPKSFGNLFNLIQLNLTKNQIISLPKSFGNLSNLKSLHLENNPIASFPKFPKLINLSDYTGPPERN